MVGHYTGYSCMCMQSMNLIWPSMWSGGVLTDDMATTTTTTTDKSGLHRLATDILSWAKKQPWKQTEKVKSKVSHSSSNFCRDYHVRQIKQLIHGYDTKHQKQQHIIWKQFIKNIIFFHKTERFGEHNSGVYLSNIYWLSCFENHN